MLKVYFVEYFVEYFTEKKILFTKKKCYFGKRMSWKNPVKSTTYDSAGFCDSGDGGIRTRVPERGKRISSAPRYDHFDTSP